MLVRLRVQGVEFDVQGCLGQGKGPFVEFFFLFFFGGGGVWGGGG